MYEIQRLIEIWLEILLILAKLLAKKSDKSISTYRLNSVRKTLIKLKSQQLFSVELLLAEVGYQLLLLNLAVDRF